MHAQSSLPMRIERFGLDDDSLSIAKKAVKLGNLWERGKDLNRLKIAPLFFSACTRECERGEIRFDSQGSLFYGGPETKETGTNRFVLCETTSGFQAEPRCAYQFSFSDKHVHLRVVRIDHINEQAKEVVLEVCTLALWKISRATAY